METSDIIATAGVSILLLAFFLQTIKAIKPTGIAYSALNFIGAALAGYASWLIDFLPFVILECVWVLVSLFALINALRSIVSREKKQRV